MDLLFGKYLEGVQQIEMSHLLYGLGRLVETKTPLIRMM